MTDVELQHSLEVVTIGEEQMVVTPAATVPTHRCAYALATGVRTGMRTIWAPMERQTSSKARLNWVSPTNYFFRGK